MGKYLDIQNNVIKKYGIHIETNSTCYTRTHAHVKERKVCKWKQTNSMASTFTLLREVGHIETTKSKMLRCESEFYATVWAIERCKEYGLEIPSNIIKRYQDYINREHDMGVRRGGNLPRLDTLQLRAYL